MNIHDLIDRLVTAATGPDAQRAVVAALEAAAPHRDALAAQLGLPDDWVGWPLYRTPSVTIMAHTWPAGMAVPPHEHHVWSVVTSLRGSQRHRIWETAPEGEPRVVTVGPGDVLAMGPDEVHGLDNPDDGTALAIHVYGGDLFALERNGWDPQTGAAFPMDGALLGALVDGWNTRRHLVRAPLTRARTLEMLGAAVAEARSKAPIPPTRTPGGVTYTDEGAGPPLVFLHGLTYARRTWRPITDALRTTHRCVAIDLPGHGDTLIEGDHEAAVAAIHEVIEHLGLDRPVLVGHSAGAVMAALYAADHPIAGLIDVDQPLRVREFAAMLRQLEPALRGPAFPAVWERFEQSMGYRALPFERRAELLVHHRVRQEVVLRSWSWLLATDPDALQTDMEARLGRITAPLLSIHGGEKGGPGYPEWAEATLGGTYRREVWEGAGHLPHLADVDRFVAAVRDFSRETQPIVVETTAGCRRTPPLVAVLEEIGANYTLQLRPDGWFAERGELGPVLTHGDVRLAEVFAAMRYACASTGRLVAGALGDQARADAVAELLAGTLSPAVARLRRAPTDHDRAQLHRGLRQLEVALAGRESRQPALTYADLAAPLCLGLPSLGVPLADYPRVAAWASRMAARPAHDRARERLTALA